MNRQRAIVILMAAIVFASCLVATVPIAEGVDCMWFPATRVFDPGNGIPAYCGASGDGCGMCFAIVIVTG